MREEVADDPLSLPVSTAVTGIRELTAVVASRVLRQ